MKSAEDIRKIVDSLSLDVLAGQVLAYDIQPKDDLKETIDIIKRTKPGTLYFSYQATTLEDHKIEKEKYINLKRIASISSGIPAMITVDVENGPGSFSKIYEELPHPMAWGASLDEERIERAGELTANVCRNLGIELGLAPVVDLNINFNNPVINIRAISDEPNRVIKMAGAYVRGMEKNGLMSACLKHFPGDGVDDRNQHFMTTINSFSKTKWMKTYGKVYKSLFKEGVSSVMVGHIALPAFDDFEDECGYMPASLSKSLITDLLRNELNFKGCIISDAMSMIGTCTRVPLNKLAVSFLNAGGDLVLFPEPTDYDSIIEAVNNGELSIERLKDAVYHVLMLKNNVHLFDDSTLNLIPIENCIDELKSICDEVANESIKIVRNFDGVLPIKLKPASKILLLDMHEPHFKKPPTGLELMPIEEEFKKRGYQVDRIYNAKHKYINEIIENYDLVVINSKISSLDYHGATMRVGWDNIMTFWRAYILKNKNLVFVSFGDPYKLYDFPYIRTYINAFSYSNASQRAAVKIILGEIQPKAKNPVSFKSFFERED